MKEFYYKKHKKVNKNIAAMHHILNRWEDLSRQHLDQRAEWEKASRERRAAKANGETVEPLVDPWIAKETNDLESMKQWVKIVYLSWRKWALNNNVEERTITEMTKELREDLFQEIWTLLLATKKENLPINRKGETISLEALAFRRINQYCRHNNRVAIDTEVDPNFQRDSVKPMHSYPTDPVYIQAIKKAVMSAELTANEKMVLMLWSDHQWSETQIAEHTGKSRSVIHKTKDRAFKKILGAMVESGTSFDRLGVSAADIQSMNDTYCEKVKKAKGR